jgi:hypothetical protein
VAQADSDKLGSQDNPEAADEAADREDLNSKRTFSDFSDNAIHLVRTSQLNTLTLSQMADQKASILIGATFVVFSLSVTRLTGTEITWSTLSLAATAFFSSLCAVIAVLPSFGRPPKNRADFNLLFFGHFSAMDIDEWSDELLGRFKTDEDVFRTMLRDVHQNGTVLYQRKYRFLTYAYSIFLGGLTITVLIYAGEYFGAFG